MSRAQPFDLRSSVDGFTIIEALVALAVVAASLAAIGSLVATTVRGRQSVEQHVGLVATARAIEAGLPRDGELVAGEQSGRLAGYSWRMQVQPIADPGGAAGPLKWLPQHVILTVRAPAGSTLQLDTVRLQRRPNG